MDPRFHNSSSGYLVLLAAGCLLAAVYIGPIALAVWLLVAVAMRALGEGLR